MRTALVGGPGTQLADVKSRCCNRRTRPGQSVLWALTRAVKGMAFTERLFILHVDCLEDLCARAPKGNSVLSRRQLDEELEQIQVETRAALARRRAS